MFGPATTSMATSLVLMAAGYKSFTAIDTKFSTSEEKHWLVFWTLYGVVQFLELFLDLLIYWVSLSLNFLHAPCDRVPVRVFVLDVTSFPSRNVSCPLLQVPFYYECKVGLLIYMAFFDGAQKVYEVCGKKGFEAGEQVIKQAHAKVPPTSLLGPIT